MSPPCQNQGYVLDGYPKTLEQAQSLFGGKSFPIHNFIDFNSFFFFSATGDEGKETD